MPDSPLKPADPAAHSEKRLKPQDFAARYPARILVVEDQPLNQKVVCMLLQRLGYEGIALADNGQQAVAMAAGREYDIIFMDILMPVMDGIDAAHAIRLDAQAPRQPAIIATSGHAMAGVKERCREAGMNGFLAKPVSMDDFRRVIPPSLEAGAAQRLLTI